jgi:hypothetical protein
VQHPAQARAQACTPDEGELELLVLISTAARTPKEQQTAAFCSTAYLRMRQGPNKKLVEPLKIREPQKKKIEWLRKKKKKR